MNASLAAKLFTVGLIGLAVGILIRSKGGATSLPGPVGDIGDAGASPEAAAQTPVPSAQTIRLVANLSDATRVISLGNGNTLAAILRVSSPSFATNASIPRRHSEEGEGVSPALYWTPVVGAKSYALLMEDADAKGDTPFVHWLAWNVPAHLTHLPQGLLNQARLTDPMGLSQGKTSRGRVGYVGPRPPVGDPPHHYHLQVLALDTLLGLPPGADRDALLSAVSGHVLAKGQLIGTFQQEQPEVMDQAMAEPNSRTWEEQQHTPDLNVASNGGATKPADADSLELVTAPQTFHPDALEN